MFQELYSALLDLFWLIIVVNIILFAFLIVFFINARINLYRQIRERRFLLDLIDAAKNAESSTSAASALNITYDQFVQFCKDRGIDTPEIRKEKKDRIEQKRLEAERKIQEEEALWRAEQERRNEERRKTQEEEARKRKERLKKFGFK